MVSAFRALVQDLVPRREQLLFYPQLNFPLIDDWDLSERFAPQSFPCWEDSPGMPNFLSSSNGGGASALSVQFGEFAQVYGSSDDHFARFDAVVTCFFIDTASSLFEVLAVIGHVLRPGGVWINSGPLHYHQREAVPYSHRHVLQIVRAAGFDALVERQVRVSYCGDDLVSMKPEMYTVPLTAFRFSRPLDRIPISNRVAVSKESTAESSTAVETKPEVGFSSVDFVML